VPKEIVVSPEVTFLKFFFVKKRHSFCIEKKTLLHHYAKHHPVVQPPIIEYQKMDQQPKIQMMDLK